MILHLKEFTAWSRAPARGGCATPGPDDRERPKCHAKMQKEAERSTPVPPSPFHKAKGAEGPKAQSAKAERRRCGARRGARGRGRAAWCVSERL